MTPVIPLSPLRIENHRLGIECWFTGPPSQVGYGDLQIEPAARELKRCRVEFRGPEMPFGVIRSAHTLAGDPQEVGVEFAVRVLVVEDRYCIFPDSNAGKFADRMSMGYRGFGMQYGTAASLGKARRRGIEGTKNL